MSQKYTSTEKLVPEFIRQSKGIGTLGKKLVIIQMSGGNDGLNTIIPYQNDIYYKSRPNLAIKTNGLIPVNDELAFNKELAPLRSLFDEGQMTILNNVGYPNPNRSHFKSMDIWHMATNGTEKTDTGWLGRLLDNECGNESNSFAAIEVGSKLSLALKGENIFGYVMADPDVMYHNSQDEHLNRLLKQHKKSSNDNLNYLYKNLAETFNTAAYIYEKINVYQSKIDYPNTELAAKLKMIAELIVSGISTSIYYVSLTGFDTHIKQPVKHPKLLAEYAGAVKAFVKDLKRNDCFSDTMIFTFSEFGRRVEENASSGTDHGAANNAFLIGNQLKTAGFYNEMPNLKKLFDGDLIYSLDFRSIYQMLLKDWLGVSTAGVLRGQFDELDIIGNLV